MQSVGRVAPVLVSCLLLTGCGRQTPTSPTEAIAMPPVPGAAVVDQGLPETFVGAGDIATCDGTAARETGRLLDAIGGTVFTLGDNAYPDGAVSDYRDCYDPAWGRHKGRTRPVPGNHEYQSTGATPYFGYFGASAGPSGLGYYSFDLGAWHVVALNSNIAANSGSAQTAWLRADLAAHPAGCTLAYWHHPLFTSGENGETVQMRDIWRVLYAANVDVVLNGHEHFYERFAPQDPNGAADTARGIRQFIAGTGGSPLRGRAAFGSNSELLISAFGVLRLTLRAGEYDWEFIPVAGRGDRGTGACH